MESPFQRLLEFIFANIWVVIIIGGFIFNTFRRFTSGQSEPTTQIPFPKQFNPFDQERTEPQETYNQSEVKTEEVNTQPSSNTFYERYLELQENNTYGDFVERNPEVSMPKETNVTRTVTLENRVKNSDVQVTKNVSKNKVVEGIIWSEILGPPRAKRPFQRRN